MYWAWKNLDCDYYGFFHYRRVLDFTPHTLKARLLRAFIPQTQVILKYHLQPHNIYQFLQESQADIVLPKALKLRPELSAYEDFKLDHIVEDLDKAIAYITKTYPHMQDCIQRALFTKGAKMYHWNLAIYRREVFFEYAQWLFDVLLHIEIDYMHYDSTQGRVFGFLAERLFNVWLDSMRGRLRISERKVRLLYTNQSKFFGKRVSKDYERYYFFFIRVWKRPIK
ncbi:DUF4422 domain-containing protein [Helicobacter marmotae]|uniref:DUF4422 domain-containing protein n=2 Tax=Helicobacter marmotae TaxID=152490 RepID=A0A3D8I6T2_9HELI|nr:DUF4422 domain-containing protein [Helicobacter marmotae]